MVKLELFILNKQIQLSWIYPTSTHLLDTTKCIPYISRANEKKEDSTSTLRRQSLLVTSENLCYYTFHKGGYRLEQRMKVFHFVPQRKNRTDLQFCLKYTLQYRNYTTHAFFSTHQPTPTPFLQNIFLWAHFSIIKAERLVRHKIHPHFLQFSS